MPVELFADLFTVNAPASTKALTVNGGLTVYAGHANVSGKINSLGSEAGFYFRLRTGNPAAWWAWYSHSGDAQLYNFDGTTGKNVATFLADGTINTQSGTVAFVGHTHAYLPLAGGTLTGKLECRPANGAVALSVRRAAEGFDRVQLWESGLNIGDGASAPVNTQFRWSGASFEMLVLGATKFSVSGTAVTATTPIYSTGLDAGLWTRSRSDQTTVWGLYSASEGQAAIYRFSSVSGTNCATFGADGLVGARKFTAWQTTGESPFSVVSTTVCSNLNADLLDGLHASSFEASFAKGNLIQGNAILLTGTTTGRLVGSGDVTISAPAHTHSGSDIDSGTVATARLSVGTGANDVAAGNHAHDYLPLGGGNLTGGIGVSYDDRATSIWSGSVECTASGCNAAFGAATGCAQIAVDTSGGSKVFNLSDDGSITCGSNTFLHTGVIPTKPASDGRYALRVASGVATWEVI